MRFFKHWEYEGGTATPFIANWPSVITQHAQTDKPGHIIDLMATCLDVAKGSYPKSYKGNHILPTEGLSLLPLMEGKDWLGHESLFFEHEGNRAVRQKDWKLVSKFPENKWQLYNIKTDRNELIDKSQKYPEIVKSMELLYNKWATSHGVIPYENLLKKHP
jgi:arylsulfatase